MAEIKVFLALLARNYDFVADTSTDLVSVPMTAPRNGLPVTVRHRRSGDPDDDAAMRQNQSDVARTAHALV